MSMMAPLIDGLGAPRGGREGMSGSFLVAAPIGANVVIADQAPAASDLSEGKGDPAAGSVRPPPPN